MSVIHRIGLAEYFELARDDPDGFWELFDGEPRSKPGMSFEHNDIAVDLGVQLANQLDRADFRVRINAGRVRAGERNVFIPDVFVFPTALGDPLRRQPGLLETYTDPLPLVVEIWSRSTGGYDVATKLRVYRQRGDREIWRIHPYECRLTRWVRQPDGGYAESTLTGGIVELAALPGVRVDLDTLFAG
ncbi:MAG: Uma2 family endonuclease [Thermomicrobiales bacterium]|nr:Uma2 family endonuclease [Thermomicrobiales bacterium]